MTEPDLHSVKLNLAVAHGYTGDQAVKFAERLTGETPEELAVDAESFAALIAPTEPPRPRATDPSQGRGDDRVRTEDPGLEQFKEMVNRNTRIYVA